MQQTAVNPIYTFLGASPDELPLLNLAGPMTGLLIFPHLTNKYLLFIPIIGLGIAWASTVTFGAIFKNLLGDDPNNAITFAAILLACAAAAIMWIKEPQIVRDVDDVLAMPDGRGPLIGVHRVGGPVS
jgi:hypothetical protein